MHFYTQSDRFEAMSKRIRELEEICASAEIALEMAWDEVDALHGRERRLTWTVMAFGLLAVVAIIQAMGR